MWQFLKPYVVAFGVFLVIEGAWLTLIAKNFYQKELGFLMSDSPKLIPTAIFALVFVAGLVFFVITYSYFCPGLCRGARILCHQSGPRKRQLEICLTGRFVFWFGLVLNLRSDQPGDIERLALDRVGC